MPASRALLCALVSHNWSCIVARTWAIPRLLKEHASKLRENMKGFESFTAYNRDRISAKSYRILINSVIAIGEKILQQPIPTQLLETCESSKEFRQLQTRPKIQSERPPQNTHTHTHTKGPHSSIVSLAAPQPILSHMPLLQAADTPSSYAFDSLE